MSESNQRKQRTDKGKTFVTHRDISILTWIGEQYAARLDQVQQLLGRDSERETKVEGELTVSSAHSVINRWKELGFVKSDRYFYRQPSWVWLTSQGLKQMGFSYSYQKPSLSTLDHLYWINQVRLYVEAKRGEEIEWTSEREMRSLGKKAHYADAQIHYQGKLIGIEVELSRKKQVTILPILQSLTDDYETIWYFARNRVRGVVEGAVALLSEPEQRKIRIYSLEELSL